MIDRRLSVLLALLCIASPGCPKSESESPTKTTEEGDKKKTKTKTKGDDDDDAPKKKKKGDDDESEAKKKPAASDDETKPSASAEKKTVEAAKPCLPAKGLAKDQAIVGTASALGATIAVYGYKYPDSDHSDYDVTIAGGGKCFEHHEIGTRAPMQSSKIGPGPVQAFAGDATDGHVNVGFRLMYTNTSTAMAENNVQVKIVYFHYSAPSADAAPTITKDPIRVDMSMTCKGQTGNTDSKCADDDCANSAGLFNEKGKIWLKVFPGKPKACGADDGYAGPNEKWYADGGKWKRG